MGNQADERDKPENYTRRYNGDISDGEVGVGHQHEPEANHRKAIGYCY
jgi:hypothetical protein